MRKILSLATMVYILIVVPSSFAANLKNKDLQNPKNISVTLQIVISEGDKEILSDMYQFSLNNGETGNYKTGSNLPYTVKDSVNFIQVGVNISVKPHLEGKDLILDSQVEGTWNTEKTLSTDITIPVVSDFSYRGSNVIRGDQFMEVFHGKLQGVETPKSIKIFVKAKE